MPRMPLQIAQGFYVDASIPISSQQCVGFYPYVPQTKTITDYSLIGVSGIERIEYEVNDAIGYANTVRGGWEFMGDANFIIGNIIYDVRVIGTDYVLHEHTPPSDILGSSKVISMSNGDQLCIICPDLTTQFNAYIFNGTNTVAISDSDFDGPVAHGCFIDGFFVFIKKNSNKFFISDLRDGLTYDALDYANAESDPDNLKACAVLGGILYLFGEFTFEQWRSEAQGAGFPFVKASVGAYQFGCIAPLSLKEFNGESLIWIGGGRNAKPSIWATTGGNPVKISTPAIDVLINSGTLANLQDAYCVVWGEAGQSFAAFTVPNVCTVVYNSITGLWHEQKSFDRYGVEMPWRPSCIVSAYGYLFAGDSISDSVGFLSSTHYKEFGNQIISYFSCPSIDNGGKQFTVKSVELMLETGTAGISETPTIRMSVSADGGRLYSPEISRTMGVTGDYLRRVFWSLLGRYSRSFTVKFAIDGDFKKVIVKGEIDIGG